MPIFGVLVGSLELGLQHFLLLLQPLVLAHLFQVGFNLLFELGLAVFDEDVGGCE